MDCTKLNLQIYQHQVSGKTPKFTDKSCRYIYKSYSQSQGQFFELLSKYHIGHKSYDLSQYIPEYFGVFTQSEILNQEDTQNSTHENSNLPNQVLQPVDQIAKQQISHLNTVSQRKEWIYHINSRTSYERNQKFLKMNNLTCDFKYPNIMDLKLGIKKSKSKTSDKLKLNTTLSHCFRINGLSVRQFDSSYQQGTQIFMSKYYCQKISLEHLNKHLAFFMFDGNRIHEKLLDAFIFHLKNIILGFMKWDDIKFMSSSLYFAYDAYDPSKYTINFIDFDKYQQFSERQKSVQEGLKNCLRHFIEIKNSLKDIQAQLQNKEIMYFHENHDVIPKQKLQKYEKKTKTSIEAPN